MTNAAGYKNGCTNTGFGTRLRGTVKISGNVIERRLGEIAAAASAEERAGQIVAAVNDKTGQTGVFAYHNQWQ